MFAIRQKRAKKGVAKRDRRSRPTSALLTPPGSEAACARRGPAKGIVRSLSMVAKGLYRTIGGASTATARDATFVTTDRCDGTLTEVGKGRVKVAVKGRRSRSSWRRRGLLRQGEAVRRAQGQAPAARLNP